VAAIMKWENLVSIPLSTSAHVMYTNIAHFYPSSSLLFSLPIFPLYFRTLSVLKHRCAEGRASTLDASEEGGRGNIVAWVNKGIFVFSDEFYTCERR
jgi:hypothetical protein